MTVMPRSLSTASMSRNCGEFLDSSALMFPVASSRRSAKVDFPWSMWAMMQKFRIRDMGMTSDSALSGPTSRSFSAAPTRIDAFHSAVEGVRDDNAGAAEIADEAEEYREEEDEEEEEEEEDDEEEEDKEEDDEE